MSSTQPQPAPGCPPPTESHFRSGLEQETWPQLSYLIAPGPPSYCNYCVLLSQLFAQQTMMEDQYYPSGDEQYILEDFYSDGFSAVGMNTPNTRVQTTAADVSSAAFGRDSVPNHSPNNDKGPVGNEQMIFPSPNPTANAYNPSFAENFDQRSAPWQVYNTTGLGQPSNCLDFQDGLPDSALYSSLPIFGEPSEYNLMTPNMTNSSFSSSMGSSSASDRMASMTLESVPAQGTVPSASVATNPGQGWGGNLPATISPKMLRINPSPTPTSSSESIHNNLVASGDSDLGSSLFDQHHAHDGFSLSSKRSSHKPRKELPDKRTKSRSTPLVSCGLAPSKAKSPNLARLRPMPDNGIAPESQGPPTQGSANHVDAERSAKDDFLVKKRLEGMTYREIRKLGNFPEAESTLRGRFRTLTKSKEERVRKPEWQDNDIRLLKKAVRKLARGDDPVSAKVPWKQVADYITEHGGSYHFGNATCRKKWDDLVKQGKAALK
ncbi:hypothetical protein F5X99DRAFT_404954 [Biscogniauxia marginata]|nr:hypothetical protein F5X99DRAFT_404954 [Biscogniauxia marginata]